MRTLLMPLLLGLCAGCAGSQSPAVNLGETLRAPSPLDRHQVTVLGTPELDDSDALAQWREHLPEILAGADADVLLIDVAPARIERLRVGDLEPATSAELDFVEVIGPWAEERGVEVVAISAWSDEALRDAADYERRFPHGPLERGALSRRAMYMASLIEHGGGLDVAWLNGSDYAELSADAERFSALYNAEDKGEAGFFRIAARTIAHIEDALVARPPSRVLIVVPAPSRFFVVEGVGALEDVALIGPERLFE